MLSPIKLPVRKLEQMGFTHNEAITLQQTASFVQEIDQIGLNTSFHSLVFKVTKANGILMKLFLLTKRLEKEEENGKTVND